VDKNTAESEHLKFVEWFSIWIVSLTHGFNGDVGLLHHYLNQIDEEIDDKEKVKARLDSSKRILQKLAEKLQHLRLLPRSIPSSRLQVISPNELIKKTVYDFVRNHQASFESFDLELDPSLQLTKADPLLLGEALRNLLDNSLNAIVSKENGKITIKTHSFQHKIAIDVIDNGIGFPPEITESIFKMPISFRRKGGFGLGLYITRAILEHLGAEIELVRNGKPETLIRILLKPLEVDSHNLRRNVLILEDSQNWQEAIKELLVKRDFNIFSAYTEKEATKLIRQEDFDLAFLDLRLDDSNFGISRPLDIARLLRERNPEMKIIILSAYMDVEILRDSFNAGIDEVLDKSTFSKEGLDNVINSITLRRETERESLKQSELNKLTYEIVSMMSHELRSPLNAIQRNAEALSIGALGELNLKQEEAVKRILKSVSREFNLLNAHLDINKIERGIEKLDYKDCNLVELVSEEIAAYEYEATTRKIQINSQLPNREAIVKIDVNRFRLALNPLMDNAIKFSPDEGVVTVDVQIRNNYVEVKIQDEGPGIKPEEIDGLLESGMLRPYQPSQRLRGSGLGLSIAKRLIQLHNGTLWVESDGNRGTIVSFRIPIKKA